MTKDIKRLVNDHSLACRAHERAVKKREALFDKYTEALAHETNAERRSDGRQDGFVRRVGSAAQGGGGGALT